MLKKKVLTLLIAVAMAASVPGFAWAKRGGHGQPGREHPGGHEGRHEPERGMERERHSGHRGGHEGRGEPVQGAHRERHDFFWDAAAIGLGAAVLGGVLLAPHWPDPPGPVFDHPDPPGPPWYGPRDYPEHPWYGPRDYPEHPWYDPPEPLHEVAEVPGPAVSGHWEYRRVWVPPVEGRVWNPGHYNPGGEWVAGEWIQVEKQPGHWTRERIWID